MNANGADARWLVNARGSFAALGRHDANQCNDNSVMKSTVYLETTIASYLVAAPSRDVVIAGHQQITRDWWERRHRFELYVSAAVVDEAERGDAAVAQRRIALLNEIPVLDLSAGVHQLAARLIAAHAVPAQAMVDALHIAVAAVNEIDYLLTWNCRHIANAAVRGKIEETCRVEGFRGPVICTPEELLEV